MEIEVVNFKKNDLKIIHIEVKLHARNFIKIPRVDISRLDLVDRTIKKNYCEKYFEDKTASRKFTYLNPCKQ